MTGHILRPSLCLVAKAKPSPFPHPPASTVLLPPLRTGASGSVLYSPPRPVLLYKAPKTNVSQGGITPTLASLQRCRVHRSAHRPVRTGEKQKDFASKFHDPKREGGRQRGYEPALSSLVHTDVPTEGTALLRVLQQDGFHPEGAEGGPLCSQNITARSSGFPEKDRMSPLFIF